MSKIQNKKKPLQSQRDKKFKTSHKIIAAILAVGIILLFLLPNILKEKNNSEDEYMFKKEGELLLMDSLNMTKAKIDIEIADTDYDRQLGLMFRKIMNENQGMLFIFPAEEMQSFWMRNTNISLDMIFVNSEKKIVTIHKSTTPLSDQSYSSTAPAKYVIEVNAGFLDRHNIKEGDRVNWMGTQLSL